MAKIISPASQSPEVRVSSLGASTTSEEGEELFKGATIKIPVAKRARIAYSERRFFMFNCTAAKIGDRRGSTKEKRSRFNAHSVA